ncbi:hypothetical protein GCM10027347_00510 [Larkinella harenae]
MSKVQDFIASGILNEYCLGLLLPEEIREVERMARLHPLVQRAIDQARQTAEKEERAPKILDPELKNRVLDALDQLGEPPVFDLQNLPLINVYSDNTQWQRTIADLQPASDFRNLYAHPLRNDGGVEQFILWVRQEVKPEEHHHERESFLILEGQCECQIGEETVQLSAGDFVDIPLETKHTVRVLSAEPVKAIIQRVKLAV